MEEINFKNGSKISLLQSNDNIRSKGYWYIGIDLSSDNFCGKCEYLSPKEYEQTNKKEDHICTLHNKRVFHRDYHPYILKCEECLEG